MKGLQLKLYDASMLPPPIKKKRRIISSEKVTPFTNGTDFLVWQERNCYKCHKYESKSTRASRAGCFHAYYLDLGSASGGDIPLSIAKEIGIQADTETENSVAIERECKIKDVIHV